MKILSLGWGIQSFTLAAMVAVGELEPIDVAIHADTTHEREATYQFAEKWTPWLEDHGVKVITVCNAPRGLIDEWGGVYIPAFINTDKGGMLNRQCTGRWKIQPIRQWLQANRNNEHVEQWLGISLDEAERMRSSNVKYITNRWPLIERRMTRNGCIAWLERHDLEIPIKSSCVFCPFHNRAAWYEMKRENGTDWKKAIEVDAMIRKALPPSDLFVHMDLIPLIDIRSPQDNGQMELWSEECSGFCFV